MDKVRWGIIGCGDVTEIKSGPALQKVAGSELVAVMRRNGALAEDYARRHGVAKWYDDANALIHDPDVNAIYVATPPGFHHEYTLMAAKAGKPVYVEKPMARNHGECLEMIAACEEAGVPLFVAYYRRGLPKFNQIKELLDSGVLGEIRFVHTTYLQMLREDQGQDLPWRLQPELSGGGLFVDLASHTLDVLDYLLGPIGEVKGFARNQSRQLQVEDIVTTAYAFESGVMGTGIWSFNSYKRSDVNEIVGSLGKVTFSTFGGDLRLETADGQVQDFSIPNPAHVQQPLIGMVVDELRGVGKSPSTGRTAARTNRVMDELLRDFYHQNQH
ncbi:Gfo/Idh/MocA family oxidoreductase [Paenibacillus sp. CGMCC 1.16610]|uniref:Gfo/Idh/MocA family oxidoreductase n=1 Tax=Paenibacillus anseongense TaxID=2682845 RepID=A0ABW9U4H4_9BACL|nr:MULTISPECIES: Gfo/Idh/MocA family oxidoreductase [Paenibacillus]MBA2941780.1 Gfo/Idh/MocA family oxidoreductase [Paenibacillus sp. CGMCC 1.16610]MVQ34298.1 gfo/Idh/MocA family oxidoreductase [Paenibacillus anseongense]